MSPDGTSRAASLAALADRIRAAEVSRAGEAAGVVRTNWAGVDSALPGGGLRQAATHEVIGLADDRDWLPPVSVLGHWAREASSEAWVAWIGRRVWPTPVMLARAYGLAWLSRCLWIDPPDAGARLWAIDSALRCSGLVVIADGTGLDAAGSRRLQLAAEAGGTFGVLARPPREAAAASFAWSRWSVAWATPADHAASVGARWVLSLVRCKGLQRVHSHKWIIEGDERGGVVALSTEVADRRCASSAAS